MKVAKKRDLYSIFVNFFHKIVLPQNQIIVLVISTLITTYFFYQQIQLFTPLESPPLLLESDPKKFRSWNCEPIEVKAGLQIINFSSFNLNDNEFLADVIVWFEFDPSLISLDTIGKFSFDKGEIKRKSDPITKSINGKFFAEYEVRVSFSSNVTHRLFPLDDHRIYITLLNNASSPMDLVFDVSPSGFTISNAIFIRGWNIINTAVNTGYEEWVFDKYEDRRTVRHPKIIFSMDFKRSGNRFVFIILLPVFLIFFIGLFSFGFDPEDSNSRSVMMSLSSASLGSLLGYRFVINNMAPPGVGYFMLSDHIFDIFLTLAVVELFIAVSLVRYQKLTPLIKIVRGALFVIFHIILLISWYYLLFLWVK